MSLKVFFAIILAALLCRCIVPSTAVAGAILPEEAQREEFLRPGPVTKKITPVTVKNTGKRMETSFTIDLRDGLNADEAGLLSILINPLLTGLRNEKNLPIPQLIKLGLLPPLRLLADDETGPASWLPRERLRLAMETVRDMRGAASDASLELESSWLEWQTFTAARFHLYRMITGRRAITLLREIKTLYKDIYKATSKAKVRGLYPEQRATARFGYEKMKKSIKRERKRLSANRVYLDHALGLPTYVEVSIERDINIPMPTNLPTAEALTNRLNERRIDFMALQKGLAEKDAELTSYIQSRFNEIIIFIPAGTGAQWLNAAGTELAMDFPLFSGNMTLAKVTASNSKFLYKTYKKRLKTAKDEIIELLQGISLINAELERIDETMPVLIKAVKDSAVKDDAVMTLQRKKTVLAVKLLRLRLRGKLMDAVIALEIASGARIIRRPAP